MKKLIVFLAVFIIGLTSFADEAGVRNFFSRYVNAANTYSTSLPSYYAQNARIIRVVHKKDGTLKSVIFPMSAYLNQMKKGSGLAKMVHYINHYSNVRISNVGNNYKISATRTPMKDKIGLPCYFIVSGSGNSYKIIEESMDTNVQDFLKYAN